MFCQRFTRWCSWRGSCQRNRGVGRYARRTCRCSHHCSRCCSSNNWRHHRSTIDPQCRSWELRCCCLRFRHFGGRRSCRWLKCCQYRIWVARRIRTPFTGVSNEANMNVYQNPGQSYGSALVAASGQGPTQGGASLATGAIGSALSWLGGAGCN